VNAAVGEGETAAPLGPGRWAPEANR
jgi:hypothetical protein